MIMLKQSPSRNQRSNGFKVKHVLQIFLLIAICIWLLNQLKDSQDKKKAFGGSNVMISDNVQSQDEVLKLGRKDPRSQEDETSLDGSESEGEKGELEEEIEEIKPGEIEDEGRGGGDDEIDGHDQDRVEEEESEVEDLIDVDDREREEGSEEKANQLEDALDNKAQTEHGKNLQEAREENYTGDDASSSVFNNIHAINTEFETKTMRKLKENVVENREGMELDQVSEYHSINKVYIDVESEGKHDTTIRI